MSMPKDITGREVKIGDKVSGFQEFRFAPSRWTVDLRPMVTAKMVGETLYFGGISAKSFTMGFKIHTPPEDKP